MKFFIDESLSPQLALRLNETGHHEAIHPLHVGRRGEPDHRVVERCLAEDRIIVTQNARDFRRLIGKAEMHQGLIISPPIAREPTWQLLLRAISHVEDLGNPVDVIVNHVLEIDESGAISLEALLAT